MNNLHFSYDLYQPGQNYETVIEKIKSLGDWAKIQKSFWYVKTNLTAEQACSAVWSVMDRNDSLYVVDSTNNAAAWHNISDEVAKYIKERWFSQRAA